MTKIGIILGSTRPGRNGEAVARWVDDVASKRTDAEFELIDLLDYKLPHLDEALPPSLGLREERIDLAGQNVASTASEGTGRTVVLVHGNSSPARV